MFRVVLSLLLFVSLSAQAAPTNFLAQLDQPNINFGLNKQDFLPQEQAFVLFVQATAKNQYQIQWSMPKGYYLYRHAIKFDFLPKAITVNAKFPEGKPKYDDFLGDYQIYENELNIPVSLVNAEDEFTININYQGCAASGYCYPPMHKAFKVTQTASSPANFSILETQALPTAVAKPVMTNEQDKATAILSQHTFWLTIVAFLGFGLLLSFTPCVLPMVPIMTSIVLGQNKNLSKRHSFVLSTVYVVAIAVTYAIAGTLAGLAGNGIQTAFQTPWVLSVMALLFVLLALSMFGFYELKLPSAIENKINNLSRHQNGGSLIGVAIMGILSALVVSPCVTAPLVGALTYISQTGDALLGGTALFFLGLGMGLPLILVATLGTSLLPKAGLWMDSVKNLFGMILLGLAISMLARFLPGQMVLYLWALLAFGMAVLLKAFQSVENTKEKILQVIAYVFFAYGLILFLGANLGNDSPLKPLANVTAFSSDKTSNAPTIEALNFQKVKSSTDVQWSLEKAQAKQQYTLLEFSADWCISCQIMKRTVLKDPKVTAYLKQMNLLEADVTENDAQDKALEHHFGVFAPPTFLFFDQSGQEVKELRLVAETPTAEFLKRLEMLFAHQ